LSIGASWWSSASIIASAIVTCSRALGEID